MSNYSDKEKKIIKQCNEGPFHTLITKITNQEFNDLVSKLINDDDSYTLTSLISIYRDYDSNKIFDYFINKGDVLDLLGFLDYYHDFSTIDNELNQKYFVDKLIKKNDQEFIKELLNNNIYFLTNNKEKERLLNFVKEE